MDLTELIKEIREGAKEDALPKGNGESSLLTPQTSRNKPGRGIAEVIKAREELHQAGGLRPSHIRQLLVWHEEIANMLRLCPKCFGKDPFCPDCKLRGDR